jgi:hypothetical protein
VFCDDSDELTASVLTINLRSAVSANINKVFCPVSAKL